MIGPSALAPRRLVRTKAMTAFRHRNYRLFFAGQAISLVGTWMQQVAQAWLVLTITGGNPLWLGVVAAAQFLPVMVLGLFAGILADVLPKRRTLLAAQVVMMVLAAVLAFLVPRALPARETPAAHEETAAQAKAVAPASSPSDRKSTRLNSSHGYQSRMPSSA